VASYSSALVLTNCVRYTGTFPAQSPLFEHIGSFRTSNKTEVFHFKVIKSHDVGSCVNICTTISIALANIDCEDFSIAHIFYLLSFYHSVSCFFSLFILQFHIDYTHRLIYFHQQMHYIFAQAYNKVYIKISPTCFGLTTKLGEHIIDLS
jgi:hypothetical protein